jgi:hypothetical protein
MCYTRYFTEYHEMSVKYIKECELYKVGDIDKEKLYTNRSKSDAIEECIKVLNNNMYNVKCMKRNGLEALNFQHKMNYNRSTNFNINNCNSLKRLTAIVYTLVRHS